MNISELCYELYKVDWKRSHITHDIEMDNLKNYFEEVNAEDMDIYTYEDYVFEFGYFSMLYVCYSEFLESEYLDAEYIRYLLDNEKLIEMYLSDIATN